MIFSINLINLVFHWFPIEATCSGCMIPTSSYPQLIQTFFHIREFELRTNQKSFGSISGLCTTKDYQSLVGWTIIKDFAIFLTIFSDAPCDSSADYSFTACLRNSLSRLVGCRLPWDQWTDPAIPECEETRQLMEHDQWHFVLAELYERERVVNETGCDVPCNYVKYELANQVGEMWKVGNFQCRIFFCGISGGLWH